MHSLKTPDIARLSFLPPLPPRPRRLRWINRATDKTMRRMDGKMVLRTLRGRSTAPSTLRLHERAGIELSFDSEADRNGFRTVFSRCCPQGGEADGLAPEGQHPRLRVSRATRGRGQ